MSMDTFRGIPAAEEEKTKEQRNPKERENGLAKIQ